jgi:hypothetical protein
VMFLFRVLNARILRIYRPQMDQLRELHKRLSMATRATNFFPTTLQSLKYKRS